MKRSKVFNNMSLIVGFTAIALAWIWFGWKLPLVLTLFGWMMNLERKTEEEKELEQLDDIIKESPNIKKSKFQERLEAARSKK